jgi:hypothetical protein
LDDLKTRRVYWNLNRKEALDGFGRGCGSVRRQTMELMKE